MGFQTLRCFLLLSFISFPSFAQSPVPSPTPAPVADPQAVSILNQVLTNAGGATALGAIQDFTGAGQISYSQPSDATGTVAVRGTANNQFRMDVTLSTGVQTQSITGGATTVKSNTGTVLPLQGQAPECPACIIFPYLAILKALNTGEFSISLKGPSTVNGNSVNEVEIQEVIPGLVDPGLNFAEYHTIDFFIDPTTYQLKMMQDSVPTHLLRQTQFSNYQTVNGLVIPLTISQQYGGSPVWTVQFSQISFNSGLQSSDFQLQ